MKIVFMWITLITLVLIVYILLFIYRYKKNRKQITEFQVSLSEGDHIILSSGIYGIIKYFEGVFIGVEIAENVVIKVNKYQIDKVIA